jgi:hypothetical protein
MVMAWGQVYDHGYGLGLERALGLALGLGLGSKQFLGFR